MKFAAKKISNAKLIASNSNCTTTENQICESFIHLSHLRHVYKMQKRRWTDENRFKLIMIGKVNQ